MNKFLLNLLCGLLIIFTTAFNAKASFSDTSFLLAKNAVAYSSPFKTIIKPSNVIYPATLQAHIDESLEYVKKFSESKRGYLTRTYQKGKKFSENCCCIKKISSSAGIKSFNCAGICF